MPVTLNIKLQDFLKGLGLSSCYEGWSGLSWEFGMFNVKVTHPGNGKNFTLGTGLSTLMISTKGASPAQGMVLSKALVEAITNMGWSAVDNIEAPAPMPGKMTEAIKAMEAQAKASAPLGKDPLWNRLNLPKVKLADATGLGQRVEGTSGGSTYYVVALSDKLKVAARVQSNKGSFRAEGTVTPEASAALTAMGVSHNPGGHWSAHFGLDAVPIERVVGAFLTSTDVAFTAKLETKTLIRKVLA